MTAPPSITRRLQLSVPELNPFLDKGVRSWEEATGGVPPDDDHVFGALLAPYTAQLLRENESRTETIRRIFEFLEEQLGDASEWVRNIVEVSFCEQFAEERDILPKALSRMGPRLRRSIEILRS